MMVRLSGFRDEISLNFEEQLDVLLGLGIRDVELRSAWGKNVLDWDDDERHRVQSAMTQRGMKVSYVDSKE